VASPRTRAMRQRWKSRTVSVSGEALSDADRGGASRNLGRGWCPGIRQRFGHFWRPDVYSGRCLMARHSATPQIGTRPSTLYDFRERVRHVPINRRDWK
jgi:hypothetical protein